MVRNVFLSFVEEDLNLANLFRGQARNVNNDLEFRDYSVKEPFNSSSAEYIKQQIRNLIDNVSVTLCLIGYNTHTSNWVNWEIETSALKLKGLVGVRLHSSQNDIPPSDLGKYNGRVVNWDIPSIVRAIEQAAK